jgi:phosphatidylinositol alpha-1,6-mannosyltransferase
MKVAYLLPSLKNPSGWRSYSTALIRSLAAQVEPVIFAPAAFEQEARGLFPGCTVYILPETQEASLSSPAGMSRLLATYFAVASGRFPGDIDLVHSLEAYPTGLVGHWLARRLRRPHVISVPGSYGVVWHTQPLDRLAYAQVLKAARLVCPISHGTSRMMQQYFGPALAKTNMKPILIGNDYARRVPRRQAFEREFPAIPTLLSVGDVKPRKGQHASLAAFALVKRRLPAARYLIAGLVKPNPYFQQLQDFIAGRGLQDVTFLGAVPDEELQRLYAQSSLFVLTPEQSGLQFEGFGLVYLEAGAYGLPVVATRSGGVPDAVKDRETGLLAEPGDTDGIAAALLRLLTDGELLRQMGRANRLWAETLTWERFAGEQLAAYQDILEGVQP